MKTILKSIQTGWHFLFHPRETVDKLRDSSQTPRLAWFFLIFTVALWALITGYVNLVLKETARGREKLLGVSMGPDILMTLLTVPLGILTVALAAFLVSRIARWLGGNSQFNYTFYTLAFTLCAGSFFFDL
ncbi:MAG TPA: hypothetical protein EYP19_01350, partial [Desulfobacterales bacterium]|nr:hypothetical protein [Desulfobacterales bacterium]